MTLRSYVKAKTCADHRLWIGKVSGAIYLKSPHADRDSNYTYTQLTPGSNADDVGKVFRTLNTSMIEPFHGEVTLAMD